MPLSPGAPFGSYEILAPLGAGGMGEVYRARDLKLQRDIALKVLPDAVARDADRRARFEREAYVLASLNHPNIAGIYGIAEDQGVMALVLELVEGHTLEERLAHGALPLEETTAIARRVAEALDAAHEAGIVHRDLKPANIKLRPDGSVKVPDFGLAKTIGDRAAATATELSHLPTAVANVTAAGLILGTAAYMAPEQARGQTMDKRADNWAFGVVLWEMMTGRRLFDGETLTDTLAAVLTREIDWSWLPASTPPALVELLRRCLERDPKKRLRDIGDVRLDASALAPVLSGGPSSSTARRWWLWGLAIAAALIAGIAIGRIGPEAETTPPAREVRFTFTADDPSFAAISPDGSMAVVSSAGPLRVRDLAAESLRELSGTDGAGRPFWSPDSRTIGFGRAGRLWRVSATGGAPVVICDLPAGSWDQDAGGAWMSDDTIVFTTGGSPLMRVPAAGGDPVQHLVPNAGELHFHTAHALPSARGVLYVVHREEGEDTLELFADGKRKVLLQAPGQSIHDPVYSPTGHILFAREPVNEGVWALPFSLERLEATGTAYLIEAGLGTPSVSTTGTFLNLPAPTTVPTRLQWHARDGTRLETIGEAALFEPFPELSPDGTQIAISERVSGTWGLSVIDIVRGTRMRLAVGERVSSPAWAPDGRSILYSASPAGSADPVIRRAWLDGSPTENLETGLRPVSRGGSRYFFDRFKKSDFDVLIGTLDRTAPTETFVGGATADVEPQPSPDGRLVAYMSMPSIVVGNPEVVLKRYPATDARWQVSSGGGSHPRWSAKGDRVYYITADGLYEVEVTTSGETLMLSRPRRLFARRAPLTEIGPDGFDVARDGRILLLEQVASSTERLVHVVVNWTPRRAPGT
jgi:Tol biopolymer transport system component